ncbi:MAG: hypothetical protein M3O61_03375 [Gemmatimonadota bacterium]|nr:hypothetical protein [Gemmatimonadota bacterium]
MRLSEQEEPTGRGIYEEPITPGEIRALKFVGRDGTWLARLECRLDLLDGSVSELAYQLLDLLEPPAPDEIHHTPTLRLLPPGK